MTEQERKLSLEEKIDELLRLQKAQAEQAEAFVPYKNAITPKAWMLETGKSYSCQRGRKQCLGFWCLANGRTVEKVKVGEHARETFQIDSLLRTVNDVLEDIKDGRLGVYESCRNMIDWVVKEKYTQSTIVQYRSMLPGFFKSVIGPKNFSDDEFKTQIPPMKQFTETAKKIHHLEEVRRMLTFATPQYRALIGVFVNSGWRIEEVLTRKWYNLEVKCPEHGCKKNDCPPNCRTPDYGRLSIKASDTKARYDRVAFLTPETVTWLQNYHSLLTEKSGWLFPGYQDTHLLSQTAGATLKNLFRKAGLEDSEDAIYSAHSFRTLCDSLLSRCGYDRKFIELTIGHRSSLGANIAYKDWGEAEEQWKTKCILGMTIEKKTEVLPKDYRELTDRLKRIEDKNRFLEAFALQIMPEELKKQYETMLAQPGTFNEFGPGEYQGLLKLPLEERRKKLLLPRKDDGESEKA